ncbi:MAG: DUF3276 family protein [Alistipes sp.]|nr:DUF3276 family protein [Alistipes sp.]
MTPDFMTRHDGEDRGEHICSKAVRAGKRTYFIDVKATRGDDYYITITESRKRVNNDGSATFSRNQIYLYKEDFAKFAEGLSEMVDFVKEHKPEYFEAKPEMSIDEEFEKL